MHVQLNINELIGMSLLAATDSMREPIQGVRIESDGTNVTLIATNGRQIGALRLEKRVELAANEAETNRTPFAYTVKVNARLLQALPFKSGQGGLVNLVYAPGAKSVTIMPAKSSGTTYAALAVIEGEYPKWKAVFPKHTFKAPVDPRFDYTLIEKFHRVQQKITGRKEGCGTIVRQCDSDAEGKGDVRYQPMLITLGSVSGFVGLLMPMVGGVHDETLPDWVKE